MDLLPIDHVFQFLNPQGQSGVLDYAFYKLIDNYFTNEINDFGFALMKRMMKWVASIAFTLAFLYFLIMGYGIVTGQSRDSMSGLLTKSIRVAVILTAATTMSFGSTDLFKLMSSGLDREIHEAVSGNKGQTSAQAIDENLAYMQIATSAIDAVKIADGDEETREQKARAMLMAGFGTASVPMTSGALLLMYKFGIGFWVGLAPLFILCLMFDQTKELFRKWLMSGIATYFAMAALSVMSAMAMKFTAKVAVAFWVAKAIGGIRGLEAEGMSSLAIQQGGLGLIITAALITVPPMVGMFFHGALGSFSSYSAFNSNTPQTSGNQGQSTGQSAPPTNHAPGNPEAQRPPGQSYDSGGRLSTGGATSLPDPNEIKKK